jgi:protein-disulfide isomerase
MRPSLMSVFFWVWMITLGPAFADTAKPIPEVDIDILEALSVRVIGDPTAKVRLVEYFSLTCPHCAKFHIEIYPKLKEKYIDTGLVQMEYRDFPLDQWGLRAAALARCVGSKYYSPMIDVLLKQQKTWAGADNIFGSLLKIGQLAGLNKEFAESCMTNDKLLDGIIAMRMEGTKIHGIDTTPSFLLNDKKISAFDFEEFDKLLNKALN